MRALLVFAATVAVVHLACRAVRIAGDALAGVRLGAL